MATRHDRPQRGSIDDLDAPVITDEIDDYDAEGRLIRRTYLSGAEERYEYNEQGKKIYEKRYDGREWRWEYDERGNCVHVTYSERKEDIWKDENGNFDYGIKSHIMEEQWCEYDADGNKVYYKDSCGDEWWYEYEFRKNGTKRRRVVYRRLRKA